MKSVWASVAFQMKELSVVSHMRADRYATTNSVRYKNLFYKDIVKNTKVIKKS